MKVYVTESLSPNRSKTPEGFLLCSETPIARTGTQVYGAYEIPVPLGPDGKVLIEREEAEVFRQETIDSFSGKPVTMNHPEEDVTPKNWHQLSVGTVLNPRRGIGDQSHLLIADLLITDQAAMDLIDSGVREVSCGYDAKYEVFGPGRGRQFNIVGNHVALVPKARCGGECSIQDHATADCCGEEEANMTVAERLKKAFGITDEKKLNEILADEAESATKTETHIHVHTRDEEETEEEKKDDDKEKKTHDALKSIVADAVQPIKDSIKSLDERMSKFEDAKEDEPGKKDDEDDKEKYDDEKTKDAVRVEIELTPKVKTKDSAALEDSFNEALALAEVISPGISAPTFDSAQPAAKTAESICQFRRKVLDKAAADQPEVKQFMDGVINGRDFKTYDCAGVKTVFQAVGVFKKQANNSVRDGMKFGTDTGKVRSIAELNKQNREFYGANKA